MTQAQGTYRIISVATKGADHWTRMSLEQANVFAGDRIKVGSERCEAVMRAADAGMSIIIEPVGKMWDREVEHDAELAAIDADIAERAAAREQAAQVEAAEQVAGYIAEQVQEGETSMADALAACEQAAAAGHPMAQAMADGIRARVAAGIRSGDVVTVPHPAGQDGKARAVVTMAREGDAYIDVQADGIGTWTARRADAEPAGCEATTPAGAMCLLEAGHAGMHETITGKWGSDDDTAASVAAGVIDQYVTEQVASGWHERALSNLLAVAETGAACTVRVGYYGNVTVWVGDDAAKLATLAGRDAVRVIACHVGCSAHCTHDAEPGADVPNLEHPTWAAIDTNGDREATLAAIKLALPHARGFDALGMYGGQVLPSLLLRVGRGTDVLRMHAALRDADTGYHCAAILSRTAATDADALALEHMTHGDTVATLEAHRVG